MQEEGEEGGGSETICKIILSASPRRNSPYCKNEYIVSDARERKCIFVSKTQQEKKKREKITKKQVILSASPRRNSPHCKNEYIVSDAREKKFIFLSKKKKKKPKKGEQN